ncbi:proton-conducting transporter membrane subunit [Bengtsoniella intestinalis]|uniref:complex I subunit 5 family protein n=1 Tax=Bengtsoniella intestinalis TaxID=3073143 RepID=UPI00391FBC63
MLILPIFLPLLWGLGAALHWVKPRVVTITAITAVSAVVMPFLTPSSLPIASFPFDLSLTLTLDGLSILFTVLITVVWLFVAVYATAYFKHDDQQERFFAFYLMALGSLMGLCYAGNLITFYLFFELMSLSLLPTVVHDGTPECLAAGRKYIYYSIGGALLGLLAIFYVYSLGLGGTFTAGGIAGLGDVVSQETMGWFLLVYVIGFGCKAGLFPLHGWLKTAHPLAPAPASAVLSGITTKAGILAMLRGVYYIVGAELIAGSLVQHIILGLSLVTILLGSTLAYKENVLKTRLAYSTVSQVSYVIFGIFLLNPTALTGALLHVIAHAMAKNGLFLFAGTVIHETGCKTVDALVGYGATMKKTFTLFLVASLSLVGVPATAGFVSKWYLVTGALELGTWGLIGVSVILISALLTAGYLLTIAVKAFFVEPAQLQTTPIHVEPRLTPWFFAIATITIGTVPQLVLPWIEALVHTMI